MWEQGTHMPQKVADFVGTWRLERWAVDQGTGAKSAFAGQATIRADGGYSEHGQLTLPNGQSVRAERQYLWRDGVNGIQVYFTDGRPFHVIHPQSPKAQHWCAPDMYHVSYDFSEFPIWRSKWIVQGPKKNYVMRSCYGKHG